MTKRVLSLKSHYKIESLKHSCYGHFHIKNYYLCTLFVVLLCFFSAEALADCNCGVSIPMGFRLNKLNCGVGYTQYEKEIGEAFHRDKVLFEQLFKLHIAKYSNISGSIINFRTGKKEVYRSAILSENLALLSELVKSRAVKSIIVLTNSKIFNINPLIDKEREIFTVLGGKQFHHILDFDCDFDFNSGVEVERARAKVTAIIKLIESTYGPVLIHCLGGEHRSEVVFEVMQRCMNKLDMSNITKRYKCHTGWQDDNNKGNFRQENIDFIRDFPCELLNGL